MDKYDLENSNKLRKQKSLTYYVHYTIYCMLLYILAFVLVVAVLATFTKTFSSSLVCLITAFIILPFLFLQLSGITTNKYRELKNKYINLILIKRIVSVGDLAIAVALDETLVCRDIKTLSKIGIIKNITLSQDNKLIIIGKVKDK